MSSVASLFLYVLTNFLSSSLSLRSTLIHCLLACLQLMILVDYGGSIFPIISHAPWNGLHLADFVMPFFLFLVGISLALVYKNKRSTHSTFKPLLRSFQLFILGILLQGGYFHGINSFTYGLDIQTIRFFGVLQRISIGYILASLCEICLPTLPSKHMPFFKTYYSHWLVINSSISHSLHTFPSYFTHFYAGL